MRRAGWVTAGVVLAWVLAPGSAAAADGPRRCDEPTRGWQRATAAQAGMDRARLDLALHAIQDRRAFAVRIYRHGCLVATDTNPGTDIAQYETWGVTRAVLSLLTGRAMQLGILTPEDPVGALLPRAGAAHGALRVSDLLTLTSGLRSSAVRDEDLGIPDHLHDALATPIAHRPETRFHESPGAMALLVAVLEAAAGDDVQAFAERELFVPLGVPRRSWRWLRDQAGHTQGGWGFAVTVDDLARLAELLRRDGVWEGRGCSPPAMSRRPCAAATPTPATAGSSSSTPARAARAPRTGRASPATTGCCPAYPPTSGSSAAAATSS